MADFQTSDFRGFQMNGRQQGRQASTLSPPQDETLSHTCQLLRTKIEVIRQQEKVNLQKKNNKKQQIKAEMQVRDIKKMIKENQEILQKLNKKLSALSVEQQRQKAETSCINSTYIDAMVQQSEQFQDIQELFRHYNTQKLVQEELKDNIEKKKLELENYQAELTRMKDEHYLTQMTLEARIHHLNYKLDVAKENAELWERAWEDIQWTGEKKKFQLFEINMAIFNFCKIIWDTGIEIPKPDTKVEIMAMLDKIQEFVCDLKLLWELHKAENETYAH
ncbi:coiled-coil domain-containing protein 42 homolog [Tachysurus ichikawai]